jgi:hypothetical protein
MAVSVTAARVTIVVLLVALLATEEFGVLAASEGFRVFGPVLLAGRVHGHCATIASAGLPLLSLQGLQRPAIGAVIDLTEVAIPPGIMTTCLL